MTSGGEWASWTSQGIAAGSGGVMTVEVGVLTGNLTLHTTWTGAEAVLTVQYTDALDWYTVKGSPVPVASEHAAREVHQRMVRAAQHGHAATAPVPPAG